ncbi:60S ribosomal protein L37a [Sphaerodactylus townsendi]|uniref:60S ribosomal protein L37a n=1 Tax=Sphaerodactylus townsendi TaxID=933632 RepID=UPI0020272442|nr:60S ribosomal protein L37a [Sphaerodactylus townsendi]
MHTLLQLYITCLLQKETGVVSMGCSLISGLMTSAETTNQSEIASDQSTIEPDHLCRTSNNSENTSAFYSMVTSRAYSLPSPRGGNRVDGARAQWRLPSLSAGHSGGKMAKRTKKVGIVGKYGTRYGASLRKMVKKIEISQHAKYTCSFCGKTKMKRKAVGIWHCGSCMKTVAGGAWTYNTTSAVTVKSAIRRLKELKDQ